MEKKLYGKIWYTSDMAKKKLTQLRFNLPVEIFKEGNYFIAHTPVLDLSVQGDTEQEAKELFVEAVVIFFEELEELGTTEKVLKELGWTKVNSQWQPPFATVELHPIEVSISV